MCQIFHCPEESPSRDILSYANDVNSDGIGFAWVRDGRVEWSKGWTSKQFDEVYDIWKELPFPKTIHFRLATHGGMSGEMTHPFNITRLSTPTLNGRSQNVLFHNGVWHDYNKALSQAVLAGTVKKQILDEPISDSRAMAILAGNFGENILDLVDVGSNKVLILKGDGDYTSWGKWNVGDKEGDKVLWWHSNPTLQKLESKKSKSGSTTYYPKATGRVEKETKSGTSECGESQPSECSTSTFPSSGLTVLEYTKDQALHYLMRWQTRGVRHA